MVLINDVKYACQRCIRGHRVSRCSHLDKTLIMVKRKGRPTMQKSGTSKNASQGKRNDPCTCGGSHGPLPVQKSEPPPPSPFAPKAVLTVDEIARLQADRSVRITLPPGCGTVNVSKFTDSHKAYSQRPQILQPYPAHPALPPMLHAHYSMHAPSTEVRVLLRKPGHEVCTSFPYVPNTYDGLYDPRGDVCTDGKIPLPQLIHERGRSSGSGLRVPSIVPSGNRDISRNCAYYGCAAPPYAHEAAVVAGVDLCRPTLNHGASSSSPVYASPPHRSSAPPCAQDSEDRSETLYHSGEVINHEDGISIPPGPRHERESGSVSSSGSSSSVNSATSASSASSMGGPGADAFRAVHGLNSLPAADGVKYPPHFYIPNPQLIAGLAQLSPADQHRFWYEIAQTQARVGGLSVENLMDMYEAFFLYPHISSLY